MTLPLVDAARNAARALADLVDSLDAHTRSTPPSTAPRAPAPPTSRTPPSGAPVASEDPDFVQTGRHRGERLTEISDLDLAWYARFVQACIDNPEKRHYRTINETRFAAALAERDRRAESRAPEEDAPAATAESAT